jgi:hypothetical protein
MASTEFSSWANLRDRLVRRPPGKLQSLIARCALRPGGQRRWRLLRQFDGGFAVSHISKRCGAPGVGLGQRNRRALHLVRSPGFLIQAGAIGAATLSQQTSEGASPRLFNPCTRRARTWGTRPEGGACGETYNSPTIRCLFRWTRATFRP